MLLSRCFITGLHPCLKTVCCITLCAFECASNLISFFFSLLVDDSAILDCQFSEFYHTPPPGFEKILFEQQIF